MFYIDEMRLKSEYCRILQKLFIFRDMDSIPADLTPFGIIDRLFTVQSLAILSQQEQHLLLKLVTALPRLMKILRTREPALQAEAQALLPTNLRAFLSVMFEVGKNRGIYRGREREVDPKKIYMIKQDRALRVLAWALRELDLCPHPDFPPHSLTVEMVGQQFKQHSAELIAKNPHCAEILAEWKRQSDRVIFIAFHENGDDQISERLYDQLSPESMILLLFMTRLIHHNVARVTKRAEERAICRQEIVYIFTNLKILQDPANPPYGLSMRQALKTMFEGDLQSLDEKAKKFLAERKASLKLYEALLEMDDLASFVKEFAKLKMADQIFLSALQSIDKFYNEHGRFAPHDDYWFNRSIYTPKNLFYTYDGEALPEQSSAEVVKEHKPEEGVQKKPLGQARNVKIEEARKATLLILEQLGLIKDALHPAASYDITTLCRGLFSDEMITHLSTEDALFISERTRCVSLYQVLQSVSEEQQQKFFSSLQENDAGFLLALRSLDDRFYDIDAESYLADKEEDNQEAVQDYHQLLPSLELVKTQFEHEATPFAGVDRQDEQDETVDVESIDGDPDATSQRVWSKATTQGICRLLKLSYNYNGVECTECNALRALLDELFTLESFVKLEKADQLFLIERKPSLPHFIKYVIEHDAKVKKSIYLILEPRDQGFLAYVSELKYRKREA